jgi:ribosomal protein S18 acetylase RimI-like enzyme
MSVEVRDARVEEAPAIRALLEEHAMTAFGEPELSEDEVRSWFSQPKLWIQVAERNGEILGYLDVRSEEGGRFDVDARTLVPEIAPVLVTAAEEHARSRAEAPVLRGYVQGDEPLLREVFEEKDWQPIRHSFQMRIELGHDLREPEWPEGLEPRNFGPGEEERVYEAHMDSFADHWDFRRQPLEDWRRYTVDHHGFDPMLWWLVDDGDELAAISLNSWHFSGDPEFGWIEVLGVRPAWRRRGLATALLRHSFRNFRERGATRVGLGVDGKNTTGALHLYERAGMRQVRRNDTYEKTL